MCQDARTGLVPGGSERVEENGIPENIQLDVIYLSSHLEVAERSCEGNVAIARVLVHGGLVVFQNRDAGVLDPPVGPMQLCLVQQLDKLREFVGCPADEEACRDLAALQAEDYCLDPLCACPDILSAICSPAIARNCVKGLCYFRD